MAGEPDHNFVKIKDAIDRGIRVFFIELENDRQDELMYEFLIEVNCEGTSIEALAGTEEGLTRIAKRYAKSDADRTEIDEWRIQLRWASEEGGWYASYEKGYFDRANQFLIEAHQVGAMELYDERLNRLVLEVLQELDREGFFGRGEVRQQKAFGMCYVGGDNSEEEFFGWLSQVNSPEIIARVKQEREESFEIDRKRDRIRNEKACN
jgi:hypothetical protein